MKKDKAQETAEKVTVLSVSLFEMALQISHIVTALHLIHENIHDSAHLITDIIKELPPEVQEKLRVMKAGDIEADKDSGKFVDWVRRILKDGGTS